ncbi:MAG: glutaredoxin family protein [Dehalococcoidia bacterium]|nr:MAG: glutaredoxin family protein [Dehalococcoidia bacterium]
MSGAPNEVDVVLYIGTDCHLCDIARHLLLALRRSIPFHLREVPIASDPDLERRFLLEVPVVEVDGEIATQAPVEIEAVRAAVVRARLRRASLGGLP